MQPNQRGSTDDNRTSDNEFYNIDELLKQVLADYETQDYEKALEILNKILPSIAEQDTSKQRIVYGLRADINDKLGHYTEATKDYSNAIAISPEEAEFYSGRGLTSCLKIWDGLPAVGTAQHHPHRSDINVTLTGLGQVFIFFA